MVTGTLAIICSGDSLSPIRRQANTCSNGDSLSVEAWMNKVYLYLFQKAKHWLKMYLNVAYVKCLVPFCSAFDVVTNGTLGLVSASDTAPYCVIS